MSIDLSQFHQVFFEESFEGLDIMETGLLELQPGADIDSEAINSIFRAAHSIKGGGGTFGFISVTEFTHHVETLLDQVRDGTHILSQEDIDLLLKSVDYLRSVLETLQSGGEPDVSIANNLISQYELALARSSDEPSSSEIQQIELASNSSSEEANEGETCWEINFKPNDYILKTGNEPVRMFRELSELGNFSATLDASQLPSFMALMPDNCYLSWNIELIGDVSEEQISEVFEWIIDDCELKIDKKESASSKESKDIEAKTEVPLVSDSEATSKPPVPSKASESGESKRNVNKETSIRVSTEKVDTLINMVGELVITQSMLGQLGQDFDLSRLSKLREGLAQLEHNTRELQESVMRIRMLPMSFSFSRFPRLVRDISQKLNKKIELVLLGEQTELDKTVMEKIGDPLVHLVRNSLDHGIETPDVRVSKGKPETGVVTLNAFHQGGNIVIEISDDGAGINTERVLEKARQQGLIGASDNLSTEQINDMIFHPGFSTAQEVSDISGRGVGMDVVRRNIQELNGTVEVRSNPGQGTTFRVRLPLTLAILDGQLVRVGNQTYIFPLVSIIESLQLSSDQVNRIAGDSELLRLRSEYVPIIRLYDLYGITPDSTKLEDGLLVVVEAENHKVGIVVDDLLAQQQVVIKSLEQNYQRVEGVSGATILGDGTVALILDIIGLVKLAGVEDGEAETAGSKRELQSRAA